MRILDATPKRSAPTQWLLYEHDDGRRAVAPSAEAATFANGEPKWHRVGPVEVHGARAASHEAAPIDVILYCPNCGMQHIDAPDNLQDIVHASSGTVVDEVWTNPPHKSHLCHGCRCVWRPADVPTNGVREVKTRGAADTWPAGADVPARPSFYEWLDQPSHVAGKTRRQLLVIYETASDIDLLLMAAYASGEGGQKK